MANDLLDNETVQNLASVGAAAGALAFAGIGLVDTNVLVDTAGLAGQTATAGYAISAAAGAVKGWNVVGAYTED